MHEDADFIRGFLREIGLPQDDPTIFNVDANNVLTLVYNLIASKMTRHINRRELIVRSDDEALLWRRHALGPCTPAYSRFL